MHAGTWLWLLLLCALAVLGGLWLRWHGASRARELHYGRPATVDWRGDVADVLAIAWWVVAVAALIVSIGVGYAAADTASCHRVAEGLQRDSRYSWLAGCLVETDDGRYVDSDNYRVTNEEAG